MTVRTRFAPSPTGYLHIGGARTALYAWLEARRQGGTFVLRIEDTDRERSTAAAVQAINEGMAWLGLDHDEGPYYQSQRFDRYRQVVEDLLAAGKAYYAYESREELDAMRAEQMARGLKPRYNGYYRDRNEPLREDPNRVIRFKNPLAGPVVFDDRVKGRIQWLNDELDDLILWRSDGHPTYNFVVVVDDIDMAITDVIRGDDHVNNTPRQINLYQALGAPIPRFAHLPMILGPDGQKLSKRHGAVSVLAYRDQGFLPQALLNYLVRLGWSHGDQEIFSREEMIQAFAIDDVNVAASRFDPDKLGWLNQQYLIAAEPTMLAPLLAGHLQALGLDPTQGPDPAQVVPAMRERAQTLAEMADKSRHWYGPLAEYDEASARKHLTDAAREPLTTVRGKLAGLADWQVDTVNGALKEAAAELELGMGRIAQPLRVAITGSAASPSIDVTVYLAGRGRALDRIDTALTRLG
ncbi:MAG: glutamate--tRNA ligase [Xanthomonadales bacterium]|nr:glutamate--tRNA ligase [Xanthomonadales bacterium]